MPPTYPVHEQMIPESVHKFVDAARASLGANVVAVVMVGSFARGDQSSTSDVDLCVIVNKVDSGLLHTIGGLVNSISTENELNPAVVSLTELRTYPDWFEIHKLRHDGVVVWGGIPDDITPTESELVLAKRIAREVLMSSRHYLAVAEPASKFEGGKLRVWNLKPLSFALRYYHFHKTGHYIRAYRDLAEEYPILRLDPVVDHQRIVSESIDACEQILDA